MKDFTSKLTVDRRAREKYNLGNPNCEWGRDPRSQLQSMLGGLKEKFSAFATRFEARPGEQKVLAVIQMYFGIFVAHKLYNLAFGAKPATPEAVPVKQPKEAASTDKTNRLFLREGQNVDEWSEHFVQMIERDDFSEILENALETELGDDD